MSSSTYNTKSANSFGFLLLKLHKIALRLGNYDFRSIVNKILKLINICYKYDKIKMDKIVEIAFNWCKQIWTIRYQIKALWATNQLVPPLSTFELIIRELLQFLLFSLKAPPKIRYCYWYVIIFLTMKNSKFHRLSKI